MLKLESALVVGDLEGKAVFCHLGNHRVIFILKDRREGRKERSMRGLIKPEHVLGMASWAWIKADSADNFSQLRQGFFL